MKIIISIGGYSQELPEYPEDKKIQNPESPKGQSGIEAFRKESPLSPGSHITIPQFEKWLIENPRWRVVVFVGFSFAEIAKTGTQRKLMRNVASQTDTIWIVKTSLKDYLNVLETDQRSWLEEWSPCYPLFKLEDQWPECLSSGHPKIKSFLEEEKHPILPSCSLNELLSEKGFESRLRNSEELDKIWDELPQKYQSAAVKLVIYRREPKSEDTQRIERLKNAGYIIENQGKYEFFSPLLTHYVRLQNPGYVRNFPMLIVACIVGFILLVIINWWTLILITIYSISKWFIDVYQFGSQVLNPLIAGIMFVVVVITIPFVIVLMAIPKTRKFAWEVLKFDFALLSIPFIDMAKHIREIVRLKQDKNKHDE